MRKLLVIKMLEEYFQKNREKIKTVIKAFNRTEYGKQNSIDIDGLRYYLDFKKVPLLDDIVLANNPDVLVIPADNLYTFSTTGTTGKEKVVHREIGTIVNYPKEMSNMLSREDAVFTHSERRALESYYETHDVNHKRLFPNARFIFFSDEDSAIRAVKGCNVLQITEYPSMLEWLCFTIEGAIENKKVGKKELKKEKVYVELSGDVVSEKRLEELGKRLTDIFGIKPEMVVTYGLNEVGHVGTYHPSKNSEIVYRVIPSEFVEEVDNEIILTPLNTKGAILLRYKTGDSGKLFFKDGEPFLEVNGKRPELGYVSVAGSQFSLPSLLQKVKEQFNWPVQIECKKKEDSRTGRTNLEVILHLPFKSSNLEKFIRSEIIKQAELQKEIACGLVYLDISFTPIMMKKSWRRQNGY